MAFFGRRRPPAAEPLPWRASTGRLQLVTPVHSGHAMRIAAAVEIEGREVVGCFPEGGVASGASATLPAASRLLVTRIAQPLSLLAICDDLFAPASRLVPAPVVNVPGAPVDEDPHDGRAWKVRTAQPEFAQALFTQGLWEALTSAATHARVLCWIDDERLCLASGSSRDAAARHLAGIARAVDEQLASGALDAWRGHTVIPTPEPAGFFGTDWVVGPVDRSLLFELWKTWPGLDLYRQVRGSHGGADFVAVQSSMVRSDCLVLLPLDHVVSRHVHLAHRPRLERGNIHTEWLDFDDDFQVRSADAAVGHAVTNPRLMEYLYDHRIHCLDITGRWIIAHARRFTPEEIRPVVEVLAGARELLPRHDL